MWTKKVLVFLGLLAFSSAFPNPQDADQSLLEGIAGVAEDGERYGGAETDISADTLAEIFGINNKPFEIIGTKDEDEDEEEDDESSSNGGIPKDVLVDDAFKQCSAYAESGYRCVPYYSCDGGEIIIDGAGLFNPRFGGLDDVELNPETSKCPGSFEMCCRHPDWIGLPINNPVPIQKPPEDDLIPHNDTPNDKGDDFDTEYPTDSDNGDQVDPNHSPVDPNYEDPVDPNYNPVDPVDPLEPVDPNYAPVDPVDPKDPHVTPGYQPHCGRRNVNGIGVRIQHNSQSQTQTQFGEWPHMCAVLNRTEIGGIQHSLYVCGGSLIAPNVVLTAAHCVDSITDVSTLMVRCGEWDTQDEVEPAIHQDRNALRVILHPGFAKRNLNNDFAIIALQDDFILDRHIDTMCLPSQFENSYDWNNCVATGWGKDQFGKDGEYQVVMKQVEMDMVDFDTCEAKLQSTRLGQYFQLHDSFNCAGGEADKDTCTGDGGGPLVCPGHDGYYHQSGIIAWGVECGINGVPGVYANVSQGLCFIDYATRCALGSDQDLYGLVGCKRWAKRQYCELQNEIDTLQALVEQTTELREKGKLFRKVRELNKLLPGFEDMVKDCTYDEEIDCLNFDYFPENEEIDISIHAKLGEEDVEQDGRGK